MSNGIVPCGSNELVYRLRGLGRAGAVLHVGAHPDDEDVGLMAYVARKYGSRIVYWSATRGEGGQNRIGPDKQEALGVYRTWESLIARSVDGGETLYGPFYDFGFSKSGPETAAKWGGHDKLVREIVRAIRTVQPQIVISRWDDDPRSGHGHHRAVGAAMRDAFEAADRPGLFPELTEAGWAPWRPSKLYFSTGGDWQPGEAEGVFGSLQPDHERDGHVRIDTGELDPISNRTYQEQAWIGFNSHKTQAMGFAPEKGRFYYYYRLAASAVPVPQRETSLYDGLDGSLTGLADGPGPSDPHLAASLERVKNCATAAFARFRAEEPTLAVGPLMEGLSELRSAHSTLAAQPRESGASPQALSVYLSRKEREFEAAVAECLGLQLECHSTRARISPGEEFRVTARLWNQRQVQLEDVRFRLDAPANWSCQSAEPGRVPEQAGIRQAAYRLTVARDSALTCPYWLARPREACHYEWPALDHVGQPFDPSLVQLECTVTIAGQPIRLSAPAVLRQTYPGGYRDLSIAVVPPISLHPQSELAFVQTGDAARRLELQIVTRSNVDSPHLAADLKLSIPAGWQVEPSHLSLLFRKPGDSSTASFTVTIPPGTPEGIHPLSFNVSCDGRVYDVVLNAVRMATPGLPRLPDDATCIKEQVVTTPATVQVHLIDARFVPGMKYAYVRGASEDLLDSLSGFGLDFHLLSDEQLGYMDLGQFDAVVVGPNAYLVRDDLRKHALRLQEYVEQGGCLIVQHQGYEYQRPELAPYPFEYSQPHDRVTSETAPVTILDPSHFLFHQPNTIEQSDFDGWVHDRGLYFFGRWDKRYKPFLACSDAGEAPRTGGLLITSYGLGTYIYAAYSFFRQLPAGVAGAFRLFANLLAVPAAVVLERARFLRSVSLFSFMEEEQLQAVARIMSERWADSGEYLCKQGDDGDEMYIVVKGAVEIIKQAGDERRMVFEATSGQAIGELQVLSRSPRAAAMRCSSDAQLLVIEGAAFRALMHRYPDMSDRVIQMLVQRLAAAGR